ncbi:ferrochelatase [Aliamphritea spongicola]|uniref:ferrochelatase n=1 Tax=Aliamphritea spongicola TaxID=707589 RepID=UPI00196B13DB|nr:ferrochelatase [Aliamphritea spongicola]MBN3564565.1 ferrochelatase [Aliamphritea spongicola]
MPQQKLAVVLVNLGTPDAPTPGAVRRYLKEFLSDARVVEGKGIRRLFWLAVLNFIILNIRPKKVAKLYASIWDEDSPLRKILNQQVAGLSVRLQNAFPAANVQVFPAMTYGSPGLQQRLADLSAAGYEKVLIIPLYPQYSATTTAPVYDQVQAFQRKQRNVMDIRIVKEYHDHPLYISALADGVTSFWQENGRSEKLILSYHGIPQEYADKGDPYAVQCQQTSALLAAKLGLQEGKWQQTFQSRFGPMEWLQPYTDKTLESLGKSGCESVDIMCPAFAADCLETLEEITVENCEVFREAGGKQYQYIPALNASPMMIDLLAALTEAQANDWLQAEKNHAA